MEIDSTTVPPPQEYSDSPLAGYQSESSMNFDYLHGLTGATANANAVMDSTSQPTHQQASPRHFSGIGESTDSSSYGHVDDSRAIDRPFNLNERFVTVLDQLDVRVEKFRKDALGLQEKRDFLLMSVDLIKSHDQLLNMHESDREEISCYIHRVNSRLSTVELNVRTVRDSSQEDSLSQINALIDNMITMGDPVMSRQRCQQYLNSCASGMHSTFTEEPSGSGVDVDIGPVDKQFENALLGCTLDDQKNIKRRLQALMSYLNKQTIRHQPF